MANIDVSELMSDPDFVDQIQVITRTPYVDYLGQNKIQSMLSNTVGSVQPADVATIQKLPDAMRVENLYSFWVKMELVTSDPGKYSSILVFRGRRYQVKTVANWSNFGEGFSEGVCVVEQHAP
jgi:hypothetical protein